MALPFHIVTLGHPDWEQALTCASSLPEDAIPELRLDLFPCLDPKELVSDLKRRCVVTCRRVSEYGRYEGSEEDRIALLVRALEGRPAWVDLEWDIEVPAPFREARGSTRWLRSVHVHPGVFDLEERMKDLPEGDAFKWVGQAARLDDNARIRPLLGIARDRGLKFSAFLMGTKGIPSRCLQMAWGGAFTYAAPDDIPPVTPGQIPLSAMYAWRCAKLRLDVGLCGVMGSPVLHSKGPQFHNARFQRAFKDLVYLPMECSDAKEAADAIDALGILGLSLTSPLKQSLPDLLGLPGPLNTLWRRACKDPWQGANTDAEALESLLKTMETVPVLILGDGGVAKTSRAVLDSLGWPLLQVSRKQSADAETIRAFAPLGIIQATCLGMDPGDPTPFQEALTAARPTLHWAVEWIYKEDTAFATWAREAGLDIIEGARLFELQAEAQSSRFVEGCG